MVRHKRFAVVFSDMAIRDNTGLRSEIASKLAAIVILHHDQLVALGKKRSDDLGMERNEPFDLEMVRNDTFLVYEFLHRLADDSFGRAPANERHGGVSRAQELRRLQLREERFHFAHALLMHRLALVGIGKLVADQHSVFVMFVGGDDMRVVRRAGKRARRNTAFGNSETLVSAVERWSVTVQADDLAPVDRNVKVQLGGIHAGTTLRK